eukprot:gb/GECG01009949.1/.p1 GENE.gb/GECG01009949.1/~~gb/GECG01009949.1/.p1  ORF type:complete len:701 (+),score=89.68 gb/GECG01009949.1/:1-2103(+)
MSSGSSSTIMTTDTESATTSTGSTGRARGGLRNTGEQEEDDEQKDTRPISAVLPKRTPYLNIVEALDSRSTLDPFILMHGRRLAEEDNSDTATEKLAMSGKRGRTPEETYFAALKSSRTDECNETVDMHRATNRLVCSTSKILLKERLAAQKSARLERRCYLKGHQGCVNTCEWTPDGKHIITGSDDTHLILWEGSHFTKKEDIDTPHGMNIFSAKCIGKSIERDPIASSSAEGRVCMHQVADGRMVSETLNTESGSVHRLAVPADSMNMFYSAAESGIVRRYDVRDSHNPTIVLSLSSFSTMSNRPRERLNSLGIYSVCPNPIDPNYIAIGAKDPIVRIFDVRYPLKPCARFCPGHLRTKDGVPPLGGGHVSAVDWSVNGSQLLATCNSEAIYLFDVNDTNQRFDEFSETVRVTADTASKFSNVPIHAISSDQANDASENNGSSSDSEEDGMATGLLVASTPRLFRPSLFSTPSLPNFWFPGLAYNEADRLPASETVSTDGSASDEDHHEMPQVNSIYEPLGKESIDGTFTRCFYGHRNVNTVKGVTFMGPNSDFVVSGSDCGTIFMWNTKTAELVGAMKGDSIGAVNSLSPHPHHLPLLVTSGLESNASVWQPSDKQGKLEEEYAVYELEQHLQKNRRGPGETSFLSRLRQLLALAEVSEGGTEQGQYVIRLSEDVLNTLMGNHGSDSDDDDEDGDSD